MTIFPNSIFSKKSGCHAQPYMDPLTLCQVLEKTNESNLRKLWARQAHNQTLFHWNLLAMAGGSSKRKYLHKKLNQRITSSELKSYKLDQEVTLLMTNFVKNRRVTNYIFKIIVRIYALGLYER